MYAKVIAIALIAACVSAAPEANPSWPCDPCVVQRCHTFPIHSSVGIKTTHRIIPSNTCPPALGVDAPLAPIAAPLAPIAAPLAPIAAPVLGGVYGAGLGLGACGGLGVSAIQGGYYSPVLPSACGC